MKKLVTLKIYFRVFVLVPFFSGLSQTVSPPCGNDYGSNATESNIAFQMRYGSIVEAKNAINQAKNVRDKSLGCPQIEIIYSIPDFNEPSLSEIENIWNTVHSPLISSFNVSCPRIGRYENNSALGAYYATQAGYFNNLSQLSKISDMMYDQQYAEWNTLATETRNEGVFGYIHVPATDECYPGGVVGSSVGQICAAFPNYCINYQNGQFAGKEFLISGQDDDNNFFDGGLAYDHGWAGVQMIEASILQTDPALKEKYRQSVELAGKYAISEHPVKNHNYTAKLIWLLAELYAWTGDTKYKNELNYKLEKNLIPGILFDGNTDGLVDGTTPPVAFDSLTKVAKLPGRMWDGHNSVSWYHAMNAWALAESYVAFRDNGELERANELKPYVIAMIDNLSEEIISEGVISTNALGVRDITYALLISIWKISQFENEPHPNWEKAAWAFWNTGYFNSYNTNSVCVGLYLLIQSETSYTPLQQRESFVLANKSTSKKTKPYKISPNPVRTEMRINEAQSTETINRYEIRNLMGKVVLNGNLTPHTNSIDVEKIKSGTYYISLFANYELIETQKFIVIDE